MCCTETAGRGQAESTRTDPPCNSNYSKTDDCVLAPLLRCDSVVQHSQAAMALNSVARGIAVAWPGSLKSFQGLMSVPALRFDKERNLVTHHRRHLDCYYAARGPLDL